MLHREKPGFRGEYNLFQIAHVWNRTSDLLPVLIPTVLWPCRRMMPLRKPLSSWDLLFVCLSIIVIFLWYLGIYWALNQSVGSGWSCRRPLTRVSDYYTNLASLIWVWNWNSPKSDWCYKSKIPDPDILWSV